MGIWKFRATDGRHEIPKNLPKTYGDWEFRTTAKTFNMLVSTIFRYLLEKGADRTILTDEGERPLDLVEPTDLATIQVMLQPLSDSNVEDS